MEKGTTKDWVRRTFCHEHAARDVSKLPRQLQRNRNKDYKTVMEFQRLPSDPNPSADRPVFSDTENFHHKNQMEDHDPRNSPHCLPKISAYRGEPAIYFDASVIAAKAEKFKYCLVGKFPRSWPRLSHIREWVSRQWKLRGKCSITSFDRRHVFIRLDNVSDMLLIWIRGVWFVDGYLMKVFKWNPDFRPAKQDPSPAAVWVKFPSLPVVLFQEDILSSISSLVGKPLAVDGPTRFLSRTNFARVCVEVDLVKELPCRVWIGIGEGGFWQDICYEKLPAYCLNCRKRGHSSKICKFNKCSSQKRATNSSQNSLKAEFKEDENLEEHCRMPNASVPNFVNEEGGEKMQDQNCNIMQEKLGSDHPRTEASARLPWSHIDLEEALSKSLGSSEKGNMRFGGTFSRSLIVNEISIRGMKEDVQVLKTMRKKGEESPQSSKSTSEKDGKLEKKSSGRHQENSLKQQTKESLAMLRSAFTLVMDQKNRRGRMQSHSRRSFSSNIPIFFWRKKKQENEEPLGISEFFARFTFVEVTKMTNFFRDKVGQGSFGAVFKGTLTDGHVVAVKVLSESVGQEEFLNELAIGSITHHPNIIVPLAFCFEGTKRALIYEFIPNGSLEMFICAKETGTKNPLQLEKLYQILLDVARGLNYLHHGCSKTIVHFDIKPPNILLDHEFNAKICDFGLAKVIDPQGKFTESLRGTMGYISPELMRGDATRVSEKTDVYSYGVLLLEIVGGKKILLDPRAEESSNIYSPGWIYKHLNQQRDMGLLGFVGPAGEECARKMVLVGLWCIQMEPENRPSMSKVLEMLEGRISDLVEPPNPLKSGGFTS